MGVGSLVTGGGLATAKAQWYGELLDQVHSTLISSDFEAREKTSNAVGEQVSALLNAYNDMKRDKELAIKYLHDRQMGCNDVVWRLVTSNKIEGEGDVAQAKEILKMYFNVDNLTNEQVSQLMNNPLYKAIIIWERTTAQGFQHFLRGCQKDQGAAEHNNENKAMEMSLKTEEQKLFNTLKAKVEAKGDASSKLLIELNNDKPIDGQKELNIYKQFVEVFRKDSMATRLLAQEMLTHLAQCP